MLVEDDALSPDGLRFRGALEATTDAMQQTVVDEVGPDLDALVAAGAATAYRWAGQTTADVRGCGAPRRPSPGQA